MNLLVLILNEINGTSASPDTVRVTSIAEIKTSIWTKPNKCSNCHKMCGVCNKLIIMGKEFVYIKTDPILAEDFSFRFLACLAEQVNWVKDIDDKNVFIVIW